MRAVNKHKGKRITIRTSMNIEGSILSIYSNVTNRFGFYLGSQMNSKVIVWDDSKKPADNINSQIEYELHRIVTIQKRFIDAMKSIKKI